ncbi:MAG: hypothetical protein NC117_07990 [Pseudoflavonifractor sp.]|nr:hypothetical protein [Pseudoflavonifractor sp.]
MKSSICYANQGEVIDCLYRIAESAAAEGDYGTDLSDEDKALAIEVVNEAEQNKGLLAVLLTLFCQKVYDPAQDIRNHQANIADGFAARTIDAKYITPFLKSKDFPAMAESGWLTRAFEHPEPYTLDYKISLKKKSLGHKFLRFVHNVEVGGTSPDEVIVYMLKLLIR